MKPSVRDDELQQLIDRFGNNGLTGPSFTPIRYTDLAIKLRP